jgi:alkanesulfonate monooxygenase SsuD/methylene tetrahydromethanopterin reductase-like flavin-dependent oxidoreductase (luciferase family)
VRLFLAVGALAREGATEDLVAAGRVAHAYGLDGVWLQESPELPAPLVAACALGALVPDIRIVCAVECGQDHPLALAEEAAVTDRATGGRLALALRPAPGAEPRLGECLDLVRLALAARPFRFEGPTWRVPAGLPGNVHAREPAVRVTPAPAQLELTVLGLGPHAQEAALARGLGHVALGHEPPAPAAGTAIRGRAIDRGDLDLPRLLRERAAGLDLLAVSCPAGERERVASDLARRVRPRLELAALPPGLEQHWERQGDAG